MSRDSLAEDLRSFGPIGLVAILIIVVSGTVLVGGVAIPLGALLALAWVRASGTPWHAVGYAQPKRWVITLAAGAAIGSVLKLVMKAVVMPLVGADPVNQPYQYLVGNRAMLPAAIWGMLVAGFGEETVFRGFLFERLGRLFGTGRAATTAIVLLTSIIFGLGHYSHQGLVGVEHATMVGVAYGAMYLITGRIWLPMIAHAAFDLTALAIIFWNLESWVAHWIFDYA